MCIKKHTFERFFGNGMLHLGDTYSKDLLHGTLDGPTAYQHNAKRKGTSLIRSETTAMAGRLVDIPGSQRTDPRNGVQGFCLWDSADAPLN